MRNKTKNIQPLLSDLYKCRFECEQILLHVIKFVAFSLSEVVILAYKF